MKIKLLHRSSIPNAHWCLPVNWEPANEIEGAEYIDGSWWSDDEEEAGLVCWAEGSQGDELDVDPDDLRVVATGDCRVIGEVELPPELTLTVLWDRTDETPDDWEQWLRRAVANLYGSDVNVCLEEEPESEWGSYFAGRNCKSAYTRDELVKISRLGGWTPAVTEKHLMEEN